MAIHLVINKQINLSIYASTQNILIPKRFAKRCTPLVHSGRPWIVSKEDITSERLS